MSRRLLLIALALLCASLGLTACGNKEETVTRGESEAVYVTLGEVQYQVQLSRQLDPYSPGDRDLLKGVAPDQRGLAKDEIWFGVWVGAVNGTEDPQKLADAFRIKDTTGKEFEPIPLEANSPFAYRPVDIAADAVYPLPGSASGQSPTTGGFLLFRMPRGTLDFRPLELELASTALPGEGSTIRLDV
jgi:hypothetical protein